MDPARPSDIKPLGFEGSIAGKEDTDKSKETEPGPKTETKCPQINTLLHDSMRILSHDRFDHCFQKSDEHGIAKNCENFSSRPEADRPRQKVSQGEQNSALQRVCAMLLTTVFAYRP